MQNIFKHAVWVVVIFSLFSVSTTTNLAINIANYTTGTLVYDTIFSPVEYTTLGNAPLISTEYEVVLMANPTCHMEGVEGKVVVFTGDDLPMFGTPTSGCNTAPQANPTAFARVAQKYGAAGVILHTDDQVCLHLSSLFI
jgi:hypothetical protein